MWLDDHTTYLLSCQIIAVKGGVYLMNSGVLGDITKAKELRKAAREAADPTAKQSFKAAADRLERRAAKRAGKIGRKFPGKKAKSAITQFVDPRA